MTASSIIDTILSDDILGNLLIGYLSDADSVAASGVSVRWNKVSKEGWGRDFDLARSYVQILEEQQGLNLFSMEPTSIEKISVIIATAVSGKNEEVFGKKLPHAKIYYLNGTTNLQVSLVAKCWNAVSKEEEIKDIHLEGSCTQIVNAEQERHLVDVISSVHKLKKIVITMLLVLSDQDKEQFKKVLQLKRIHMPRSFNDLSASLNKLSQLLPFKTVDLPIDTDVLKKMTAKLRKSASDFMKNSDQSHAIASAKLIPLASERSAAVKEITNELQEMALGLKSISYDYALSFTANIPDEEIRAQVEEGLLADLGKSFASMKLSDSDDLTFEGLGEDEKAEAAFAEMYYLNNRAVTQGLYPQASVNVLDLAGYAKENYRDIGRLLSQLKQDSKARGAFTYSTNRLGELDANHVQIGTKVNFILAAQPQGIVEIDQFYQAIIEKGCSLWFTLNECKVNRFWPDSSFKLSNNWTISNVKSEVVATAFIELPIDPIRLVKTVLLAENGTEQREIIHYHYENWADNQPAPCEKLLLMCAEIGSDHLQKTGMPVGINCYAGVGRTGSLANLIYGMRHIQVELANNKTLEGISINLAEMNYELRMQRERLVAGRRQFVQVWNVVGEYAQKLASGGNAI